MESSFKKGYDKTVNADGSINISLKGKSRGAAETSGYPVGLTIFFIFCVIGSANIAANITDSVAGRNSNMPLFLFLWALLSIGSGWIFYLVFKNLTSKNVNIVIKPSEGLIFNGKQLPFADIQTIGVSHQTTGKNLEGNAQVYANSHGNNIEITGWVPLALAEAVAGDIKRSSGMNWQ